MLSTDARFLVIVYSVGRAIWSILRKAASRGPSALVDITCQYRAVHSCTKRTHDKNRTHPFSAFALYTFGFEVIRRAAIALRTSCDVEQVELRRRCMTVMLRKEPTKGSFAPYGAAVHRSAMQCIRQRIRCANASTCGNATQRIRCE